MTRAPMLASTVADQLGPIEPPWDVYAERARRYEIQLSGGRVDLVRGPLHLEGYGFRVLTEVDAGIGVGFQASTDFSKNGVRSAAEAACSVAKFNRFPARNPMLPESTGGPTTEVQILDPGLWSDPVNAVMDEATRLLGAFDAQRLSPPTFTTIRATLVETSIANSRKVAHAYAHTVVEREIAIKSEGGPEGRPAGEFWVTDLRRRIQLPELDEHVTRWNRFAQDARKAQPPPSGDSTVVLPPEVLSAFLPDVLDLQFNASAVLRGLAVPQGTEVGPERLEVSDDGLLDWSPGSSPVDDEGTARQVRPLIAGGRANGTVNDVLHAAALGGAPTGNAVRSGRGITLPYWRKFGDRPGPSVSTITLAPWDGGTDEELIEQVDDGIWVQQLGWPNPDVVSATFGGELRIGYRIRQGKLAEPLRGGTIGGPVLTHDGRPSMLSGIQAVGSTARLSANLRSPTLVVKNLTTSGQ